jgi:hypothetical protein
MPPDIRLPRVLCYIGIAGAGPETGTQNGAPVWGRGSGSLPRAGLASLWELRGRSLVSLADF